MTELLGLDWPTLGWFVVAGLLLNLTPGPDVLYVVVQALRRGTWAGVVAGLGVALGCLVHVFAAAFGLSALLASSSVAFGIVKWLGAGYLLWMGVRMLTAKSSSLQLPSAPTHAPTVLAAPGPGAAPPVAMRQVFWGGFGTNVLNPKVALFFLAFVPQFIPAQAEHKTLSFVLLGALFDFNSIFVSAAYAALAAQLSQHLVMAQRRLLWLDRVAGLMFMGFGLRLASFENPLP